MSECPNLVDHPTRYYWCHKMKHYPNECWMCDIVRRHRKQDFGAEKCMREEKERWQEEYRRIGMYITNKYNPPP